MVYSDVTNRDADSDIIDLEDISSDIFLTQTQAGNTNMDKDTFMGKFLVLNSKLV